MDASAQPLNARDGGIDPRCLGTRIAHADNQPGPFAVRYFNDDRLQLAARADELPVSSLEEGAGCDNKWNMGAGMAQAELQPARSAKTFVFGSAAYLLQRNTNPGMQGHH